MRASILIIGCIMATAAHGQSYLREAGTAREVSRAEQMARPPLAQASEIEASARSACGPTAECVQRYTDAYQRVQQWLWSNPKGEKKARRAMVRFTDRGHIDWPGVQSAVAPDRAYSPSASATVECHTAGGKSWSRTTCSAR